MFIKISPLAMIFAVIFSAAIPAASRADDCQDKLVKAIKSIMTSGPMRARVVYLPTITGTQTETIEIADPTHVRWVIEQTFTAELAALEKQFTGSEKRVSDSIVAGDIEVVNNTGQSSKWQYSRTKFGAPSYISNSMLFANPDHVYEAKCDGASITYLDNPTFQSYEFDTYEERNAARIKQDEEAKAGDYASATTPSKIVLDAATGRPMKLEQDNPGGRAIPRKRIDVMFQYDPAIKVEIPKTDYKIEVQPLPN